MATIAENLQTLNETKTAIKTAIESKGQDMTDVPFTEYADKITSIPASIEKADVVKQFVDLRKTANNLFETPYDLNAASNVTDEFIAECIRFNTLENALQAASMYRGCNFITKVPLTNTSKVTGLYGFNQHFQYCYALKESPKYDISSVTGFIATWAHCRTMITLPDYGSETAHILDVTSAWHQCLSLKLFPAWDLRGCANYGGAFNGCDKLEDVRIKNIKASIAFNNSPWLLKECLVHLIRELRDTGASKTLTMGSTNLAKITGDNAVYVRLIEITDEMRVEDDLIDEKLPFELCESTNEGAMLITEYTQLKNWQIA